MKKKWPIKPWKGMKETWMHITKWKKPTWKGYILYDSNYKTFWRRENYGNSKEVSDNQRLSVGEVGDEQAEHRVFLGQWKYSVWYHNEDSCYLRLFKFMECIAPKMNFHVNCGWLWCVNVGSSIVTKVSALKGMLIMQEAMHIWEQEVYGKFLYFPLNFAVNLKQLFVIKS